MVEANLEELRRGTEMVEPQALAFSRQEQFPALPRVRRDLVSVEQKQGDTIHYVIKDPLTFRYFKIAREEMFVLSLLDGRTSPEEISLSYLEEFGVKASGETIGRFVQRLGEAGLLDGHQAGRPAYGVAFGSDGRKTSLFHKLTMVRIKAFNPDQLFNFMIKPLGFFFNRYFIAVASLSIIVAAAALAWQWGRLGSEMDALLYLHYTPAFVSISLFVVVLHEFAHGLTCKYFGGQVTEIGFLLIYFNPALYCNVSDAWLFEKRSNRLWVVFAGGFFEAFILSLAAIIWSIAPPASLYSTICLIVIAVSGVKTLFNLNPFIKLDGYYFLSDYLEIPNLRGKSFSFVKSQIFGRLRGEDVNTKNFTPREQIVYWSYAALALPFTTALILLMVWKLGNSLISKYGDAGLLILAVILLILLGDVLVGAATRTYKLVRGT
ncbi:MAG: hypothetical protein LC803_23925 [Acidobacteria bacterium]|nr:hypothetical protein [Acidobacteriota bacterium]